MKNGIVVLAAVFAGLGGFLFGYDVGVISGALLQLESRFNLSDPQKECVVSLMLLGAIIASLCGGWIVDYFGRRNTIVGNSLIFIVGAILLCASSSLPVLFLGRIVVGFGVSLSAISEIIYVSEIAPANDRGKLVSINEIGITLGIFVAYLVNFLFIDTNNGWRYMFGLSIIPALLQGVGMLTLPQSPRWLLLKKQHVQARDALERLRGGREGRKQQTATTSPFGKMVNFIRSCCHGCFQKQSQLSATTVPVSSVTPTFSRNGINSYLAQDCHNEHEDDAHDEDRDISPITEELKQMEDSINAQQSYTMLDLFRNKRVRFCLIVACLLTLFQQLTGQPNVLYYGSTVFKAAGFSTDKEATLANLLIGGVKVIATCVAVWKVDNLGRRFLLICGTIVMMGSLLVLASITAAYPPTHLPNNSTDMNMNIATSNNSVHFSSETVKWTSLACMVIFVLAYAFSFGPVTWLVLSEIFPDDVRGRAVGVATVFNWGGNLLVSLTFLSMMDSIGFSGTFFMYSGVCLIALFFIYGYIPETKGRTLEEVSNIMASIGARRNCGLSQIHSSMLDEEETPTLLGS
eukprot:m.39280 g.39280  ORF g.39280 m.39280 type:complete len:575 (-) comp6855_c1_seq2:200-1924(-)